MWFVNARIETNFQNQNSFWIEENSLSKIVTHIVQCTHTCIKYARQLHFCECNYFIHSTYTSIGVCVLVAPYDWTSGLYLLLSSPLAHATLNKLLIMNNTIVQIKYQQVNTPISQCNVVMQYVFTSLDANRSRSKATVHTGLKETKG